MANGNGHRTGMTRERYAAMINSDITTGDRVFPPSEEQAPALFKRYQHNFVHLEESFQKRYVGVSLYDADTTVDDTKVKVIDWVKTADVQASKSSSKSKVLLKRYQDWIKGSNDRQYREHLAIAQNIACFRNVLAAEPSCRAEFRD
ncbi:hypothetical protein AnigIFM63309_004381 [Aspergillus niger]|nr:hypothetical protein AnigIFM49718_003888 [Aspergillus niger]GLA44617.1 hypothetical protein AnigIFM63309_004381 [Aspergillus niger]